MKFAYHCRPMDAFYLQIIIPALLFWLRIFCTLELLLSHNGVGPRKLFCEGHSWQRHKLSLCFWNVVDKFKFRCCVKGIRWWAVSSAKGCRSQKVRWEVWELSNFFPRNWCLSYIAELSFISFQSWDVKCSHGRKDGRKTQFLGMWRVVPWNFWVSKWRSWCLVSPLPLYMFRSLKCFKLGAHLLAKASLKHRVASSTG